MKACHRAENCSYVLSNNSKHIRIMSNGTNIDVAGAINTLAETFGKLFQMQIDVANTALKALADVAQPLGKTATDLIGSFTGAATQVLQSVSSAIAPKK